jgi:hypothetical protein
MQHGKEVVTGSYGVVQALQQRENGFTIMLEWKQL